MESVSEQKALLRKKMIAKRATLSREQWQSKSDSIKVHIIESHAFKNASVIHCFVSMNEKFEVETHSLIESILSKGKRVVIPITNFKDGTLRHSELTNLSKLKANRWGVPEPEEINIIDVKSIDLILVPLLAADLEGNRLGYGKGFYDRFLADIKASCFGLVFEDFIIEKIPIDSFDKKLNGLISEKGIKYT